MAASLLAGNTPGPVVVVLRDEHRPLRKDRARHRFDPGHRAGDRRGLARAGARVAVNGRSEARVDEAVAEIARDMQGDVIGVAADVTADDGAPRCWRQLPQVDILVNNLGIFGAVPALEITDDEWRRYFEVNVLAAVRLTRAYLPGMIGTRLGPRAVIASDSARGHPRGDDPLRHVQDRPARGDPGFAKEAAGTGVTVNSVIAGPTHTGGVEDFVYQLVDQSTCRGTRRSGSSCASTARSHCSSG